MRLASYNVENMFCRAKALNGQSWAEGRKVLEAHRELNALFRSVRAIVRPRKRWRSSCRKILASPAAML
jgi:hypothetical protein